MLYSRLGFNTVQQLLIQCGWISVCPFGNFINSLIVDRVGRKRLLSKLHLSWMSRSRRSKILIHMEVFGLAGTASALIGECITVDIFERTGDRRVAGAAVFFLFWHILLFGLSFDATSYIYGAEIFPNPVRARGFGISVTGMFTSTIIFLQCAPTAFANIGWKYYLLFIAMCTVFFIVIWLYFPEVRYNFLPPLLSKEVREAESPYNRLRGNLWKMWPRCLVITSCWKTPTWKPFTGGSKNHITEKTHSSTSWVVKKNGLDLSSSRGKTAISSGRESKGGGMSCVDKYRRNRRVAYYPNSL